MESPGVDGSSGMALDRQDPEDVSGTALSRQLTAPSHNRPLRRLIRRGRRLGEFRVHC